MINFSIKWTRIRIEYEINKPHDFDFIIPMIRGALGYSLYETYCKNKNILCSKCRINPSCIYYRLFESPIYEGNHVKNFSIHPFQLSLDVNRIGNAWNPRKISLYLTLFSQPEMMYPIFITGLKRIGSTGLGKYSIKAKQVNIYDLEDNLLDGSETLLSQSPPVYMIKDVYTMIEAFGPSPSRVTIKFLTPLQIKTSGKMVREIDFSLFTRAASRRINLIEKFYGGDNRILSDQLMDAGGAVETVDSNLEWVYHHRFSTRKKKTMPLPGIVGNITVSGDLKRFLPLLELGEIFHIGGKTTFGLGQFFSYSLS